MNRNAPLYVAPEEQTGWEEIADFVLVLLAPQD